MDFRSAENLPARRSTPPFVIFEVSSVDDDLVHLVAENDMVEGIATGEGWYRAVSGERVMAHACTAPSAGRCLACRAALRRPRTTPPGTPPASRRDGRHRRRFHTTSLVTSLIAALTAHAQPGSDRRSQRTPVPSWPTTPGQPRMPDISVRDGRAGWDQP